MFSRVMCSFYKFWCSPLRCDIRLVNEEKGYRANEQSQEYQEEEEDEEVEDEK